MAQTSTFTKLVMWSFVGIGVMVVIGIAMGQRESKRLADAETLRRAALTPEQRAEEARAKAESDAIGAGKHLCRLAVERSLKDPDSVQWDESPGWYHAKQPDGTILYQPRARAKNSFGGYVAGVWECVVLPDGNDVRLVRLKQLKT